MNCRACQRKNIYRFLELGNHPPANEFLVKKQLSQPPPTASPLNVYICLTCALIQVKNYIPSGFFSHYVYVPSASDVMVRHFADLAKLLTRRFRLSRRSLVVDIGSNDGTFLSKLNRVGVRTLGVEPAENLAKIARQHGVETVNKYFHQDTAGEILATHGPASVIVTTNTINHIDDLHEFVGGVVLLLADDGVFIVEVPRATRLIEDNQFDTIYHEHLSEFSVKSMVTLFHAGGLEVAKIEILPLHGGSMRIYGKKKRGRTALAKSVVRLLEHEKNARLYARSTYDRFTQRVRANKRKMWQLLTSLQRQGKTIVGYGAPAKGNTLLNYYNIGSKTLPYLVDRSPLKQGLYTPGMHIPVFPVKKIMEDRPDYLLILAWNFKDEIIRQQREYQRAGGKFIVPIPEPTILNV